MARRRAACGFAVLALLVSTQVWAASGSYYGGTSPDHTEVLLYLDGGKFLGQKGVFHTLQADVRTVRKGREVDTGDRCQYIYNPANHAQDRIACDPTARGRLSGVVYQVNPQRFKDSHGEEAEMRCTQRCSRLVPKLLQLTAEEDNA